MTRRSGTVKRERIGALIRNHLSYLFERDEVRDPRLRFVSVADVEVSADVRYAKVFVRVLGSPEEQEQALAALRQAAGFLRTKVAGRLRLRHMPELSFYLDQTLEYGNRIDALLEEIYQTDASQTQEDQQANE